MSDTEERFEVNLLQMLVLAANVVKARTLPDKAGYLDWDKPFFKFIHDLEQRGTTMRQSELESALWACNMLDECGEFFNVNSDDLDIFINKLMNYKRRRKYFDHVYNQVHDRPKMGRPNKVGFDKVPPTKRRRRDRNGQLI